MFVLKQLRRKKSVSQTNLARAIGVSLRTIQLYEKKDANIPIKNLTKIAQYFDLTIAELYLHELNEANEEYTNTKFISKKGHAVKPVGLGKYLITVPLVSGEKQGSYVERYGSEAFLNQLGHIGFVVEEIEDRKYVAFEITNNSMDNGSIQGIPNKSIVLGKMLSRKEFLYQLKRDSQQLFILVSPKGILCKKILGYNDEVDEVSCHSLNESPEYADFTIKLDEVNQFFQLVKKQLS